MKRILAFTVLLVTTVAYSQGKSISLAKKITTPYITMEKDTIRIGDQAFVKAGTTSEGNFKYVQSLNSFNEPIQPAPSRMAFKKQEILFFKEQDGTMYAFTKYFVINIEAAIYSKEVEIIKK